MILLSVNVDHVATLRQARLGRSPDPLVAAALAELAGADGITVHLREDRRHVQDRDARLLREAVQGTFNLEMAATPEMVKIALEIKPDLATLVPEKRQELTTEGGLDVSGLEKSIGPQVRALRDGGIPISFFIDPRPEQVDASARLGGKAVELHTGSYCEKFGSQREAEELVALQTAAERAAAAGLSVRAGHGLDYRNVRRMREIPELEEVAIGHSIVARAVLVGLERAVLEMLSLLR
jgi:pyridoxine 5-phosphate synthase